jgi:RNA polymerase sigma factor (sigma-70 family)
MDDATQTGRNDLRASGVGIPMSEVKAWFIREVLPLETMLMHFLRQNWRDANEVADLRQEVYVRIYEAAQKEIPEAAKPFVFAIARNLLVDRVRRERIIPIDTVTDLDALNIASAEAGPDRIVMGRDALRRLRAALAGLPQELREIVILRKIEGLSRQQIAARLGVTERTVSRRIAESARALADTFYSDAAENGRKP